MNLYRVIWNDKGLLKVSTDFYSISDAQDYAKILKDQFGFIIDGIYIKTGLSFE